jgi:ketosteroid isomerase-like protein
VRDRVERQVAARRRARSRHRPLSRCALAPRTCTERICLPSVTEPCTAGGALSEANVAIARHAYEAIARGNGRAIWNMLHATVTSRGADADVARNGRRDVLRFMRQAVSDGSAGELVDVIDAGSQVIVLLRPAALGGVQRAMHANVATFRQGKVIEIVAYRSLGAVLLASR